MMGVNDAKRSERETKQVKSAEAKRRKSQVAKGATPADWGTVSADVLLRAVIAVTRNGSAIRLGYTRDGGAYAVGLYEAGEMTTEYVSPNDDIDEYLKGIISDFTD